MSDRAAPPACSADEIEITPEMIRAGVSAYLDRDLRFEAEAEVVAEIYRAMQFKGAV